MCQMGLPPFSSEWRDGSNQKEKGGHGKEVKGLLVTLLALALAVGLSVPMALPVGGADPVTFDFPGGTATTGSGAWGGMAGVRYPVAFDLDSCPLTMIVYDLDMSGVTFTKVNPCCGPAAGDAGLGAYAQVGIAGDTRVVDWPENGAQMFVTSVSLCHEE
jgi:hypothetical protein